MRNVLRHLRGQDLLLLALPAVVAILGVWLVRVSGRFPDDPEYSYLLNGLEVLTIYPPSYISHPGTNLIMWMALVNLLTWMVTWPFHGTDLVTDVLTRSQFYLGVHHGILMLGIMAAAAWLGIRIRTASGSLAGALTAQASLLLSFPVVLGLNRVSPEPLLLAGSLTLAGLLVPLAFGRERNMRRAAAWAGGLMGFCIAAKITAMPLLFILGLFPDWTLRKRGLLFAVGSAIFFTLPAAHHYPEIFSWFTGMATHSGSYSDGPVGLPGLSVLASYAWLLISEAPELFAAIVLYVGIAFWGPRHLRRLLAVSALVLGAQILMVLKQPSTRYLIPCVAVFALANGAIVSALLASGRRTAIAVLAAMGVAAFVQNAGASLAFADVNKGADLANRQILRDIAGSGCAVVYFYEAPTEIYQLDFGNQYAGSRFRDRLQQLYPNGFTFDWARHSFMFFGTQLSKEDLLSRLSGKCIYLAGSPLERFSDFGIPRDRLTLVTRAPFDPGRSLAVYRYQP